jgi:hypothetical protein
MNDPRTGVVLTTAPADVQERQPLPDVDEPRCHRFEIAWGHVRPQSSQTGSSSLHRGSPTPPCMLLAVQTAGRWLWRPGSLVGWRLTSESSADAAGPSLHFSSFNWFCAEYLPPFFLRRLPPRLPFADLAGPGGLHPVSTAVHHPLPFWPNPPICFPPTPNQVRRTLTRTSGAQRPITSDSQCQGITRYVFRSQRPSGPTPQQEEEPRARGEDGPSSPSAAGRECSLPPTGNGRR